MIASWACQEKSGFQCNKNEIKRICASSAECWSKKIKHQLCAITCKSFAKEKSRLRGASKKKNRIIYTFTRLQRVPGIRATDLYEPIPPRNVTVRRSAAGENHCSSNINYSKHVTDWFMILSGKRYDLPWPSSRHPGRGAVFSPRKKKKKHLPLLLPFLSRLIAENPVLGSLSAHPLHVPFRMRWARMGLKTCVGRLPRPWKELGRTT